MAEFTDPRNGVAYSFSLLTEGATKNVWQSPDTDFVVIENTDNLTVGDRFGIENPETMGWYATQISNICFQYLTEKNVPNHFLWPNTEEGLGHTFAARPLDMPPVEIVVRNQPIGSYLRRYPDRDHLEPFPEPVVEIFEKNSAFNDPFLVVNHGRETVSRYRADLPLSEENRLGEWHFRELGHLMVDRWEDATELALRAALVLRKAWELGNAKLIDIKFEFGVHEGQVMLGDTIDADCWRLWRGGNPEDPLDSQLFADRRDPRSVIDAQQLILLEAMQWLPRGGGGGNTGNIMPGGGGNTGNQHPGEGSTEGT